MSFSEVISSPEPAKEAKNTKGHLVYITIAAAAVFAVFSPGEPTGIGWWDAVLKACFAASLTWISASASSIVLLISSAIASFFVGLSLTLVAGVAATSMSVTRLFSRTLTASKSRLLATAITAMLVNVILRLQIERFGHSAVLAAAIASAVAISSLIGAKKRVRIIASVGAVSLILISGLVGSVGVVAALKARSDAEAGLAQARLGLAAAREGNAAKVGSSLDAAQDYLASSRQKLASPSARGLRFIPVAAQNYRAVEVAIEHGSAIATQGARSLETVDLESLRLRQGALDLSLLASMAPQLDETAQSLIRADNQVRQILSPWLVPPVASKVDELLSEVTKVRPEAELAAQAAAVVPNILGQDSPRRYLLIFGAPGESREFGGFVGGFGLMHVENGKIDLLESGSSADLIDRARMGKLDNPDEYPAEYVNSISETIWPQNLTSTPNIQVILKGIRDIFDRNLGGAEIDGMIYLDPFALGALSELTGPLSIPGVEEPLSGQPLIDFLLIDQYRAFDSRDERFSAIGSVAAATAQKLAEVDLPGPERLGSVMGPIARAGRFQMVTTSPEENAFFEAVKLQRLFIAPQGIETLAITHNSATASKLDLFVDREIDYSYQIDALGRLEILGEIKLSTTIADDVPAYTLAETEGTHSVLVSIYSAHELEWVTLNGDPLEYATQHEFGFVKQALHMAQIEPNTSITIQFKLAGTVAPGRAVAVWTQPLVNRDKVSISWTDPSGTYSTGPRSEAENWIWVPGQ